MDRLAQGKRSQCLVRMPKNVLKKCGIVKFFEQKRDCNETILTPVIGPSELDNFTDELRGVIPRSFEYLFFLINREVERVSCAVFTTREFFVCFFLNQHIMFVL